MSHTLTHPVQAAGQYLNIIKGGEIDRAVVENMEDLFHRKMWHQLTVVINDAIKSGTLKGDTLITFYESVVKAIETKLNPLQVVQIAGENQPHTLLTISPHYSAT